VLPLPVVALLIHCCLPAGALYCDNNAILSDRDEPVSMRSTQIIPVVLVFLLVGCNPQAPVDEEPDVPAAAAPPEIPVADIPLSPPVDELLPADLQNFWNPWHGDFDGMAERRVIRVLTTYGGYQFYYKDGRPQGAIYDMLRALENYLNDELNRGNVRIYVVPIPVSRDQLIPSLLEGHGDLIASDLTPTLERKAQIDFTRPILDDIDEVVVMGSTVAPVERIEDLSGRRILVRESSSYYEHLQSLSETFSEKQLPPPELVTADELLEAEDIIEMISLGEAEMTVMDDYKAEFWAGVLPDIVVRKDLAIKSGGSVAWALRRESPLFAQQLEAFLRKYGKGSLFGNDTYNRHLAAAARARCKNSAAVTENVEHLISLFTKYGEQYTIDWLRLAAQAYQESGLRQNRVSPAGAVGIMQIKPSTAADRNVNIKNVTELENNIHAGTKYLRFIADRYYGGEDIDELNQWLLSLAAYNAGPARIARYRREAIKKGYDASVWFDNVEIIAAQRIGRETVTYVSNIFKYYVAYQLVEERRRVHNERFGGLLVACHDT
jgi:membrane-bound lytic murein transglycosylase MltF